MITLKLVKQIGANWGIYKIPKSTTKQYNGEYILSQGIFSDYALENMNNKDVIRNLREYCYEGIFKTIKEAEMTAKYADAISSLKNLIASYHLFEENTIKPFEKKLKEISKE